MSDIPRVVLTGGVSGGHTFPLIAVAQSLRKKMSAEGTSSSGHLELLFIGSRGRFEETAMHTAEIPMKYIVTGKWRRYFALQNVVDLFRMPIGFLQALWYLLVFMPDAVFSKGGSASVPVVLAAWMYRIPVMIHDSDAVAGRANRFLGHFVSRVAIAYPSAHAYFSPNKTALTGNPVRAEILSGNSARGLSRFGLVTNKSTIVVLGGSQGAQILNKALLGILPSLLEKNIQVLHQTGDAHYADIISSVEAYGLKIGESGYVPVAFLDVEAMADALALATLVISRAGAGSIAELAATGKTTILVPLESAANHEQRMNAYDVAELGATLVLEEANLGEHILLQKIEELMNNPVLSATMAEKLRAFYHPDASDVIADGIIALVLHINPLYR
ncbi:MAG: undecaprenyldiphospho-muramoylpentapeptide beta-N-acetylglucosaminyltransferase [Minisyncoccota bacterium]